MRIKSRLIGIVGGTALIGLGSMWVYSEMPDEEYRVELNNIVIENCIVYSLFILQFSIWKTATLCAINRAVIHNATVQRYERYNITSVSIKRDDWIIDSDHDFNPDFRRIRHRGFESNDTDKPLTSGEIEMFNEAVNKLGIRQDDKN